MTFTDGLVVIGVFGAFGFMIWSRLVKRGHPIVQKTKDFLAKKDKTDIIKTNDSKWQSPHIERKIY